MPRKNHNRKTQIKFNMMLQRKAFLLRLLYRQEISKNDYESEISKLKELESQVATLIFKATRLENNKNLSQNENSRLKEENLTLQLILLKKPFLYCRMYIRQLTELCNEIKEICEEGNIVASGSNNNNIVFNSFEDAIRASEPKIVEENDEEKIMPPLNRQYRFYEEHKDDVITKTHLYNSHVINTASKLVLECVEKFQLEDFKPEPLNYGNASVKGQLHETIKKTHSIRQVNWETDTTEIILRKINAADSQPGVKAEIDLDGHKITRLLYGAHNEKKINKDLTFCPGRILVKWDDAICIATKDGALWVSQLRSLKSKIKPYPFKLSAIIQLGEISKNIKNIPEINNKQILTTPMTDNLQEINIELFAIKQCKKMPIKGLILAGSSNNWSNGINLNVIQHAINPSIEGWKNIKAINEVVKEIIKLTNNITVAAVQANAGAELHTYTAPKRIGTCILNQLKDNANPILAIEAIEIGLFDNIEQQVQINLEQGFIDNVKEFIKAFISDNAKFMKFIKHKQDIRKQDESKKSLDKYEKDELEEMQKDLFENRNNFYEKRWAFVTKSSFTPLTLTKK
ncbi:3249_t:CDS:2 [Gigaspora margarita]|uniref:3249_t:CDS:1 n=1 Tax=Gigaspora margarita TaxID=4874 RepID=A0ABM8W6E7_GIGMA|nr:3249_t:CDS:2 [Gigaspora margarita]